MSYPNNLRSVASALVLLLAGLLAFAPAAHADRWRLTPRIKVAEEYSTNPLTLEDDEEGDFALLWEPALSLETKSEKGRFFVEGGAQGRDQSKFDELDSVNPFARFNVMRNLNGKNSLFGNGSWADQKNLDPVLSDGQVLEGGRPDLERYDITGGLRHLFSTRWALSPSFTYVDYDYTPTSFRDGNRVIETNAQRDFDAQIYSLNSSYIVSQQDTFFTSLEHRRTRFGDIETATGPTGSGGQDDDQTSLQIGWKRLFSPAWSASLNGGVRYLDSQGTTTFPEQVGSFLLLPLTIETDDTTTGFVGSALLERKTNRNEASIGYNQETRPSSGRSGSVDTWWVSANYLQRITRTLKIRLEASYGNQESASDGELRAGLATPGIGSAFVCQIRGGTVRGNQCVFASGSSVDNNFVRGRAVLDWRMRKALTTFLSYEYVDQDASGLIGQSYTDHRFVVGLRYRYDLELP